MHPTLERSQLKSVYRRPNFRRLLAWSAVGLWLAFIYYWSSRSTLPGFDQSFLDLLLKKGAHLAVFGVLALLTYRALVPDAGHVPALVGAGIVAVGYGALDEFHQAFVPGRTSAALDVLIDAAGATAALAALHYSHENAFSTPPPAGALRRFHRKGSDFDGDG